MTMEGQVDLILWRHAEAEEEGADLTRRLTRKGEKHAARVAAWLLQRLPSKFAVLSSPAERAQRTAAALGARFEARRTLGPGASASDVLVAADWPAGRRAVAVVIGHQPTIGRTAALLLSGIEQDWSVKKAALWWLSTRVRDGDARVVVRAVAAPDLL